MTSSSIIVTLSNKTKPTMFTLSWLSLTHPLKKKFSIPCSTLILVILTFWKKRNSRETECLLIKSNTTLLLIMIRMSNKSKFVLLKFQVKFLWSDIKKIQDLMIYKVKKFMNIMVLSLLWTYSLENSFISWFKVYKAHIILCISSSSDNLRVNQMKKETIKVTIKLLFNKIFNTISSSNPRKISSFKCIQQLNSLICKSVRIYLWIYVWLKT